ncbi:ABC transporter ATP-binding protein [Lachnospiraceae bacterium OttesenSCG-928-D06]|nr:ABC transporter ATP-binding protein [Lachnospiraceae bacterium OttesenSCG-928-D06]
MKTIINAKNIVTTFPFNGKARVRAADGVSVELKRGEIIGLVGESGSGKSVTSMSILQLILPPGHVEGEVYIDGIKGNVLDYGFDSEEARTIRGGKIGMIFQEPMTSLNPILTVGFQIQENITTHLGIRGEDAKNRTIDIMRQVGISNPEVRYGQYPAEFSGGMRQRIMIAMVLAAEPDVLIADEATTALDVTMQAQILELIKSLSVERNLSVIIVTHNLGLVARYAHRIYVMYCGGVVETADKMSMFENPLHPYTRGLLAAVPRLDDDKERMLIPIEGMTPNPVNMPAYCKFYSRCKYREDRCKDGPCNLKEAKADHFVRCVLTMEELNRKKKQLEKEVKHTLKKSVSNKVCLEVDHLKMYFPLYQGIMKVHAGDVRAVEDVSFKVYSGETLGVVGESGCGKSTLAKCIMKAVTATDGKIYYQGTNILPLKGKEMKKIHSKITMIFQDPYSSLNPRQSAGSIVGEPLQINKLVKNKAEYNQRVDELFRMVGLDPAYRSRVPREFSGGQRQRIGIARALASEPDVIICDEAVSALDVSIQAQIINLLEELQARLGITYIFIAHDLSVVKHISDRIIVMYLGRIVETAPAEMLYSNPMHPYTKILMSAVPIADPKIDQNRDHIKLTGEIPSVLERPSGCPFSTRCPNAIKRCMHEIPELKDRGNGQCVACFLSE